MDGKRTGRLAAALVLWPALALARPVAPSVLCDTWPEAADCRGRLVGCETCHTSTWPAAWNSFGVAVGLALPDGVVDEATFAAGLPEALAAVASRDSDRDGVDDLDELLAGTNPGDRSDAWLWCAPTERPMQTDTPLREGYDFRAALTRASILYCGRSASYDELATMDTLESDGARYAALHETLTTCLQSAWWRDEGLARLADPRIRPLSSVGARSPVGIVIGDYDWDYRLWSYVLTEDRDARDLLRADYHVDVARDGSLVRVEGVIGTSRTRGPQPLEPERRAGMITTQWFFAINTMFSPLPRTTAAQAYRAYLGMDVSKQEGLVGVPGEPLDVDGKGVRDAQCAGCHATLDPLSYAFAYYEGIRGASLPSLGASGRYDPSRPARVIPGWSDPQSVLFGEPVSDVVAWADTAAESDAFARNLVHLFFRHAFEREPTVPERPHFDALLESLAADGFSANRLIHRLVDLDAFGGLAP
ncbi:MAG: DUF1585 domain-containing protein [Sandaracinus sp.]|nr:DUF1585 domain-containing protein [Sandaracinus sp.]MCB9614756.1 DUF1585 domain-containing protein [Sandaracinus sp.]